MTNLAVSNIAWSGQDLKVFDLLSKLGVNGIEVAPAKIANGWGSLTLSKMSQYRYMCEDFGLVIPSFQAFLYGKDEFQLLGSTAVFLKMKDHFSFVAELAAKAGASILVYGAPKSRLLLGHSEGDAFELSIQRLRELAEACWAFGVSIGLEAVPHVYGGEFITTPNDVMRIVKAVSHPGLVMHFDTGCTHLANLDVAKELSLYLNAISHFHISQPELKDFSFPEIYHSEVSQALSLSRYKGWVCIEMRETLTSCIDIKNAVKFVKSVY